MAWTRECRRVPEPSAALGPSPRAGPRGPCIAGTTLLLAPALVELGFSGAGAGRVGLSRMEAQGAGYQPGRVAWLQGGVDAGPLSRCPSLGPWELQVGSGQVPSGGSSGWMGPVRLSAVGSGLVRSGWVRSVQVRSGLARSGPVRSGLVGSSPRARVSTAAVGLMLPFCLQASVRKKKGKGTAPVCFRPRPPRGRKPLWCWRGVAWRWRCVVLALRGVGI